MFLTQWFITCRRGPMGDHEILSVSPQRLLEMLGAFTFRRKR